MPPPSLIPSNMLVTAFPHGRRQISIRHQEVQDRKAARTAAAKTMVLAEMSVVDLLSKGLHTALPAGFIVARTNIEFGAQHRRRLIVAGKFDRSAIMIAAATAAKKHQARYDCTWGEAMSASLRAAWTVARMAMRAV